MTKMNVTFFMGNEDPNSSSYNNIFSKIVSFSEKIMKKKIFFEMGGR